MATVTIASRRPLQFFPQMIGGKDAHHWHTTTGFDTLPPHWLARIATGTLVLDTGDYAASLADDRMDRRPMFTAFDGHQIVLGRRHPRTRGHGHLRHRLPAPPGLPAPARRPRRSGLPLHADGISTTHPGLAYVGLEFQRSFASNTLRGVHRDAEHIAAPIAAYASKALAAYGL